MENRVVEKLYLGFFMVLPFVLFRNIVDGALLPRQLFLGIFLLALLITCKRQKIKLFLTIKTPIFITVIGFLLLNFISFFQSTVTSESHAVFSKLVLLFSFFYITTALLYNNIIRTNKIVLAVVVFGIITFSFSLLEIVNKTLEGQHLLRQVNLIKGNSANKNLLSSILFLCLPFYFINLKESKTVKYVSLFGITTTLFILLTIRTRAVLIACCVFFILLLCYKIKRLFSLRKIYFLGIGILLIGIGFLSYKMYFKDKITHLRSSSSNITEQYLYRLSDSETLNTRVVFWKKSMDMFKEHPLFGVGLGNWQIFFPKYGLNDFNVLEIVNGESTIQRPHNDFIWILCETGIVGLITYLILFGLIFYQLYILIKNSANPSKKWTFYFILSVLVGYLLIAFFDFPYERIEHQVILLLLFAIVVSSYYKSVATTNKHYNLSLLLLIIPIGYSLLVTIYRLNGEYHTVKMYQARSAKDWTTTIFEAKKAENYFYKLDNTSMPLQWYEGIGNFNSNQMIESEECFQNAYSLSPYNIQVINNLASVYQVNGKTNEAIKLYHYALTISSNFEEAKLNLAALYFNQKEYQKAYSTINEIKTDSKNPKYKLYLVPILNQKINAYLKTSTNKEVVNTLVKKITTKEALLQLFFDAKTAHCDFNTYLSKIKV